MTSRRAPLIFSLICFFALFAFAAASASAKGTTVGECTSGGTKDFEDAHCDKSTTPGKGTFGHVLFPINTVIKSTATNDLTGTPSNGTMEAKIAGIAIAITCESGSGVGTVTNKQSETGAMTLSFGIASGELSKCKMTAPESAQKCTVAVAKTESVQTDPMTLGLSSTKKVGPTGEEINFLEEGKGTEMGGKLSPVAGGIFTTVTIAGAECPAALKGAFQVKGFVYVTSAGRPSTEGTSSSGATAIVTKASSISGLTFAGNPATIEATSTVRKEGGNPLIVTTTEK